MIEAQPIPTSDERASKSRSHPPPMIAVQGLEKRIGAQEILRGVDMNVAAGETLVIIGRSGGGKSVLLKNLIGLMQPNEGEIWIDGQSIIGLSERQLAAIRRKVGILFQGSALFDSMTVEENIAFPLYEAGERDERVIERKIAEMLEVIELEGQEKKMPVNLSGGMKKRVGLARAIINQPSCILYDEPTAGLDPVVSDSINRLIRRLQERYQRHERGRHPRHEERLSCGRSHCLPARRPDLLLRHSGATSGFVGPAHPGFPDRALYPRGLKK